MAGAKVDVGEGIKFVDHNVNVVAANTRVNDADALSFVSASNGFEFSALNLAFFFFKVRSHQSHATRIAYENNFVSQLFGAKMKVENRTIRIDDEFRFRKIRVVLGETVL